MPRFGLIRSAIIAIGWLLIFGCKKQDHQLRPDIVASVNGEYILLQEFTKQLASNRAKTISHFRVKFGAEYSNSFWYTTWDDHSPLDYIKEISFDELLTNKIELGLAREYGLVEDMDYESNNSRRLTVNADRDKAMAEHQVIYGPQSYSESVYYRYVSSLLIIRLKERLSQERFDISETKLREQYAARKDKFFIDQNGSGYRPYSECRAIVRSIYIDELYDELIIKIKFKAKIVLNDKLYDRIQWINSGFSEINSSIEGRNE